MPADLLGQLDQAGPLVLGCVGIWVALLNQRRQLNAQMYIEISGRFQELLRLFPTEAWLANRIPSEPLPPSNQELTDCTLYCLQLASQERIHYEEPLDPLGTRNQAHLDRPDLPKGKGKTGLRLRIDDPSTNARRRAAFSPPLLLAMYRLLSRFEKGLQWLGNCQSNGMKGPATRCGTDHLNFYIHDLDTSFRIELDGNLSGKAVVQVEQSWRTALSVIGDRSLVIALGNLRSIDAAGHALLRRWRESGAHFVAKSPAAEAIVTAITGQQSISAVEPDKQDRNVRSRAFAFLAILLVTLVFPAPATAASLEPTTSKAWRTR